MNVFLSLQSQNGNAALVKGLRRLPFTEESRVRFPYVVQRKSCRFCSFFYFISCLFNLYAGHTRGNYPLPINRISLWF